MRATYDPDVRAIAIGLGADTRHRQVREVAPNAWVGVRDGAPVLVEMIGVGSEDDEERLAAAARAFSLDGIALVAAFRAAVAVPGRPVTIEVGASVPGAAA